MKPTLPERLRRYSEACVAERLDPDFAASVREAASLLSWERDAREEYERKRIEAACREGDIYG